MCIRDRVGLADLEAIAVVALDLRVLDTAYLEQRGFLATKLDDRGQPGVRGDRLPCPGAEAIARNLADLHRDRRAFAVESGQASRAFDRKASMLPHHQIAASLWQGGQYLSLIHI